jgi:hypothetical protein
MLAECGISGAEAEALLNPTPFVGTSPVAQPDYDAGVPQMAYPVEALKHILATPDEVITRTGSYDAVPVG